MYKKYFFLLSIILSKEDVFQCAPCKLPKYCGFASISISRVITSVFKMCSSLIFSLLFDCFLQNLTSNISVTPVDCLSPDKADGSACQKQMVFGVVTAIDLLNYITTHEGRDHSSSEYSLSETMSLSAISV